MKKLLALLAVLFLCTHSWGACITAQYGALKTTRTRGDLVCESNCYTGQPCPNVTEGNSYFTNAVANGGCDYRGTDYSVCPSNGQVYQSYLNCEYWTRCTTQAEADSIYCEKNPAADECQAETDTTLFACSDNASGNGAIYRLACKATNGEVTSCNGKTNVDVAADGTLVRQLTGTCAQNGFESGIVGGASSDQDSVPNSANAECFAILGSKCFMRDKASGNTYSCDCDGSCDKAIRDLLTGSGCSNPYPQPNDTIQIGSSASTPSSSGGSSPSSSEGSTDPNSSEGSVPSSSFYDPWSPLLEDIRANTQGANNYLDDIRNNTESANGLLQAIVNKDWSPTINVSAPNVNVQGDTNIINVSVQGDTATAPAKIYNFMKDTTGLQGYADQFTAQKAVWSGFADSVKSSVTGYLDTIADEDTTWAKHGSDVDSMVSVTGTNFRAYMDTIENMPFNDTLNRWVGMITNNGVITGSGSNSCPSLLTRHHVLTIGQVSVDVGSLGGQLCTPIAGLNVTLWAVARAFLRFVVAFGCMVWIYCEVVGVKTTGEDD